MPDQPDLFEFQQPYYGQAPHVIGSQTSLAASQSITDDLGKLQKVVLALFSRYGFVGLTDEEGTIESELREGTYRARRVELVAKGLLIDSGGTRHTKSGRRAVVWQIKDGN